MFEEYIAEKWICTQHSKVNKVWVEEITKRIFERILKGGIFEVSTTRVRLKVFR